MTTENNSSLEENQQAAAQLQVSSETAPGKQCSHDGDCPQGERCVNGSCQAG
jgi:hypothetical protein